MSVLGELAEVIIAGDGERGKALTLRALDEGASPREVIDDGLMAGIEVVGMRMKAGQCFIPEVLLSARAMTDCLDLVKPLLRPDEPADRGTIVIGTVEGDVHDIGKNLVAMMLEAGGFKVVNLGTSVSPEQFVNAVKEHSAQLIGMSALLTTTMHSMKETIQALVDAGLRDRVKVMVGGAPVTLQYAEQIGADSYGADAAYAIEHAKELTITTGAQRSS